MSLFLVPSVQFFFFWDAKTRGVRDPPDVGRNDRHDPDVGPGPRDMRTSVRIRPNVRARPSKDALSWSQRVGCLFRGQKDDALLTNRPSTINYSSSATSVYVRTDYSSCMSACMCCGIIPRRRGVSSSDHQNSLNINWKTANQTNGTIDDKNSSILQLM